MCVVIVISELYKEYRSLKQAKENSGSDAASRHAEESSAAHKVSKTLSVN